MPKNISRGCFQTMALFCLTGKMLPGVMIIRELKYSLLRHELVS